MNDCLTEADFKEYLDGNKRSDDGSLPPITNRLRGMLEHFMRCSHCTHRYIKWKDALLMKQGWLTRKSSKEA